MPRIALFAVVVCALALAAAGVSFAQGSFLGVVWILLAGVSSNMAWFYVRRARAERRTTTG
ncbi:hypothetical protein K7472_15785 [Streptomyces sp. PTM05]|uniref:Secreted protein n=1 Tax=Streptantibioticus parmotrematis TaxID=2873249 RepID=A0ABS7QT00_9ACTN|nr:hypothetical protein [Streptantibioticus parmotrematis]MBY8886315.1 hypothetical protein [Streptantibioticus parmotrematis]